MKKEITYTYYKKISTPSNPILPGDINEDGVIDITDVSDINSINLQDLNNDGIIDILDVAEFVANGGVTVWDTPSVKPDPPVFDLSACCDDNYPDDHWGFNHWITGKKYEKKCYQILDKVTKISTCGPCDNTPLEEAVCRACATVPRRDSRDPYHVAIFTKGTEPSNPALKIGKGKSSVTQDGVDYIVYCDTVIFRDCEPCGLDRDSGCCHIQPGDCACGAAGEYNELPMWYAMGTNWCPGFTEYECVWYWSNVDYPYPRLRSPESQFGPYIGNFLWIPDDSGSFEYICKCADTTQEPDPCRYGYQIIQCIQENGGSVDPGISIPE